MAGGDLAGGRHLLGDRRRHVVGQVHDVVGRHLRQFVRAPRRQPMRPVLLPVGALVMEIGAQEIVDALPAMPHLRVGRPGRIIPLVMLARPRQRGQRLVDGRARRRRRRMARRCRTAAPAVRRTARSSVPASGTRRVAPARTRQRPRRRNRVRRPPPRGDSRARTTSPSASRTAFSRRNGRRSSS